jgi:hypothetical protein
MALDKAGGFLMDALAAGRRAAGWWLVATAGTRLGRWGNQFPQRLILPVPDAGIDLTLGVPRALAGLRSGAGRCCYQRPGLTVMAQVALPPSGAAAWGAWERAGSATAPPRRVFALPRSVHPKDLPPATGSMLWWGLGGPLGTPVGLPLRAGQPVAVVGPPGSGRTCTLGALARQAQTAGLPTACVPATADGAWNAIIDALGEGNLVFADNLDQAPGPVPPTLPATGTLIASLSTAAAGSFRGPGPLFQNRPVGVILWPSTPGSSAALGTPLDGVPLTPSGGGRPAPGSGLAVGGAGVVPVQCARV